MAHTVNHLLSKTFFYCHRRDFKHDLHDEKKKSLPFLCQILSPWWCRNSKNPSLFFWENIEVALCIWCKCHYKGVIIFVDIWKIWICWAPLLLMLCWNLSFVPVSVVLQTNSVQIWPVGFLFPMNTNTFCVFVGFISAISIQSFVM